MSLCFAILWFFWDLTRGSAMLGFGNDNCSFLPPYSPFCASQKCVQEGASTFPLLLCQISFPAYTPFWWPQWPHITVLILTMLLVGGWSQLLQVQQGQWGCEYCTPRPRAPGWAGAVVPCQQSIWVLLLLVVGLSSAHKSHLLLWQETFLSHSRCSCPPDKGHRMCLHRQTGSGFTETQGHALHGNKCALESTSMCLGAHKVHPCEYQPGCPRTCPEGTSAGKSDG